MLLGTVLFALLETARARSEQIQAQLWMTAQVVARDDLPPPVVALTIETLNDLIDIHTRRTVAILSSRIPDRIWLGIYSVVLLTLVLVGVQSSYGERRNWLSIFVLVLVFSVVLTWRSTAFAKHPEARRTKWAC